MTPFSPEFADELHRLMRLRRDVRHFRTDPVPQPILDRAYAAVCHAPSVGLSEPWRFVSVQDPAIRTKIKLNFETANAKALSGYEGDEARLYAGLKLAGMDAAPVQLAVFCDDETVKGKGLGAATMPEMRAYSCVAAIMQMWLSLRADDVGMGWVSILSPDQLCRDLDVPQNWRLIGFFCIGFPQTIEETPELEQLGWERRTKSLDILVR